MRTAVREKLTYCKDFLDVDIFNVFSDKPRRAQTQRAEKMNPTSDVQRRINERNAQIKLSRLINTNFTDEDYILGLDYNNDCLPESEEKVKRDLQNFLRRLKGYRKKLGLEPLKYIATSEHGKKSGRGHHHVIVNGGLSAEEIKLLWRSGRANVDKLQFTLTGCGDTSAYFIKNPIWNKLWCASKNLIKPKQSQNHKTSNREFNELCRDCNNWSAWSTRYPGYAVGEDPFIYTADNGYSYLSVRLYKIDSDYIQIAGQSKNEIKRRKEAMKNVKHSSVSRSSGRATGVKNQRERNKGDKLCDCG